MANFTVTGAVVESGAILNTGSVVALISTDSAANVSFDGGSQVFITIDAGATDVSSAVTYSGWQSANGFGGSYGAVDLGLANSQVRISYAVADDALFKNDGNLGVAVELQLDQGALFDSDTEINDSGYVNFTVDQIGPKATSNYLTYFDSIDSMDYASIPDDGTITVQVTFDETVTLSGAPFTVSSAGTATVTQISGGASGTFFEYEIDNFSADDTYTIDWANSSANAVDAVGNEFVSDDAAAFTWYVKSTNPTVTMSSVNAAGAQMVAEVITLNFSEPVSFGTIGALSDTGGVGSFDTIAAVGGALHFSTTYSDEWTVNYTPTVSGANVLKFAAANAYSKSNLPNVIMNPDFNFPVAVTSTDNTNTYLRDQAFDGIDIPIGNGYAKVIMTWSGQFNSDSPVTITFKSINNTTLVTTTHYTTTYSTETQFIYDLEIGYTHDLIVEFDDGYNAVVSNGLSAQNLNLPVLQTPLNWFDVTGYHDGRLEFTYLNPQWNKGSSYHSPDEVFLMVSDAGDSTGAEHAIPLMATFGPSLIITTSALHHNENHYYFGLNVNNLLMASIPLPVGAYRFSLATKVTFTAAAGTGYNFVRLTERVNGLDLTLSASQGDYIQMPVDTKPVLTKVGADFFLAADPVIGNTAVNYPDTALIPTRNSYVGNIAQKGQLGYTPFALAEYTVDNGFDLTDTGSYFLSLNAENVSGATAPAVASMARLSSTYFGIGAGLPLGQMGVSLKKKAGPGATDNSYFTAVVYADNAGTPGALLKESLPVSSKGITTSLTQRTMIFSDPYITVADEDVWVGVRLHYSGTTFGSDSPSFDLQAFSGETNGYPSQGLKVFSSSSWGSNNTGVVRFSGAVFEPTGESIANFKIPASSVAASRLHTLVLNTNRVLYNSFEAVGGTVASTPRSYDVIFFQTDASKDILWQYTLPTSTPLVLDIDSYNNGSDYATFSWPTVTPANVAGSPPAVHYKVFGAESVSQAEMVPDNIGNYTGQTKNVGFGVIDYPGTVVSGNSYELPKSIADAPWISVVPIPNSTEITTAIDGGFSTQGHISLLRTSQQSMQYLMDSAKMATFLSIPNAITPPGSTLITLASYSAGNANLSWGASTTNNGNTVEYQVSWAGTTSGSSTYQPGTTAAIPLGAGTYTFSVLARVVEDNAVTFGYTDLTNASLSEGASMLQNFIMMTFDSTTGRTKAYKSQEMEVLYNKIGIYDTSSRGMFQWNDTDGRIELSNPADTAQLSLQALNFYSDTQDLESVGTLAADALPKSGGTMSGPIDMATFAITNLPTTPGGANHATSKAYVDAVAVGVAVKGEVRVASVANVNLSDMPAAIDGFTLSIGQRVLLKDQTDAKENGIYDYQGANSDMSGNAFRSSGLDNSPSSEVFNGVLVPNVLEGTVNQYTSWIISSVGTGAGNVHTFGTDDINWSQFAKPLALIEGAGINVSGGTISFDPGQGLEADGAALAADKKIQVKLEGATLTRSVNGLKVSSGGITATELGSQSVGPAALGAVVSGNGITGGSGSAISLNIGVGNTQVAAGNHDHDTDYAPIAHNHTPATGDITGSIDAGLNIDALKVTEGKIANGAVTQPKLAKVFLGQVGTNNTGGVSTVGKVAVLDAAGDYAAYASKATLFGTKLGLVADAVADAAASDLVFLPGAKMTTSGNAEVIDANAGKPLYLTTAGDYSVDAATVSAGLAPTESLWQVGWVNKLNEIVVDIRHIFEQA